MPPDPTAATLRRTCVVQMIVLVALCCAVFYSVFEAIFENAVRNPETAHAIGALVMIGILVVLRRRTISEELAPGSWFGPRTASGFSMSFSRPATSTARYASAGGNATGENARGATSNADRRRSKASIA